MKHTCDLPPFVVGLVLKGPVMKKLILITIIFIATSCTPNRLDEGLITIGLPQKKFLSYWGLPTSQKMQSGKQVMEAGIGSGGGFFFKGTNNYDVWNYENKVFLIFHRRRVIGYDTKCSRIEIKKLCK